MTARWPIAAVAGGVAALAAFALLYRFDPPLYIAVLDGWGVTPFRFPFLDTHAVLSALECTARGFDTYVLNPCDVLTRAFVYSPIILDAAALPVSVAWNNWVGIVLALAFLVAVASLPAPRGAREWAVMALAGFSTMTLFAVERGNIDVLIFVLLVIAVHLLRGRGAARGAGYAVIVFAALLKYYPIVAMIAALRERPRRFAVVVAVSAAVGALFLVHYWRPLHEAMMRVPSGSYFTDLFGVGNLPNGLFVLLSPLATRWSATTPVLVFLPSVLVVLLIYYAARNAVALAHDVAAGVMLLPQREALLLVIGAALIVGCFFAGQNIGYRGIFFLLLLPGLLALARDKEHGEFRGAAWMIVFLMWGELFRDALQRVAFHDSAATAAWQGAKVAFWMFREIVWWRVIGTLLGVLLYFAIGTETVTAARLELRALRRARQ